MCTWLIVAEQEVRQSDAKCSNTVDTTKMYKQIQISMNQTYNMAKGFNFMSIGLSLF